MMRKLLYIFFAVLCLSLAQAAKLENLEPTHSADVAARKLEKRQLIPILIGILAAETAVATGVAASQLPADVGHRPANGLGNVPPLIVNHNTPLVYMDPKVYMEYHLIYNSRQTIEYCVKPPHRTKRHRQDFMDSFPLASLNDLIGTFRRQAASVASNLLRINPPPNTPFTEVVVRQIPGPGFPIQLPIFLRATIRNSDLQNNRPGIPSNIRTQMSLMGELPQDEAGHLLAYSLGGGMSHVFNYAPQTLRLNRHGTNDYSIWLGEERQIRDFLLANTRGRVEWTLAVIYETPADVRPIGFCLQHTDYDDYNQANPSVEMCFSNDRTHDCLYDERE